MAELQTKVDNEKVWWEKRRQGIQEGFMKELDEDEKNKSSDIKKAVPSTPTPRGTSDDDAVIVESGGPAGSQGSGGGSAKKKKAKK